MAPRIPRPAEAVLTTDPCNPAVSPTRTAPQGDTPKPKQTEAAASVQPVVILAKPNPVYTDEARKLGLEGEVLLDVVFPASGPVQVNRVIRGLGHGLDENAIKAAEQIQFKPAISNGHAVDFPATIHIVFQIAELEGVWRKHAHPASDFDRFSAGRCPAAGGRPAHDHESGRGPYHLRGASGDGHR